MNYGKILRLIFDGPIQHVSSIEKTRLRLVNAYGEYTYPINVTVGRNANEVYLHFNDINNLVFPAYLECLQTIRMGSDYVSFGEFITEIFLNNLWPIPSDFEHLELSSVDVIGEIALVFDGKAYADEYIELSDTIMVVGTLVTLTFKQGYLFDGYVALSETITVAGQYCDINGVPL